VTSDGLWIVLVVVLVLSFAVGALFVPIRLRLRFQGRGDPSGSWALAGAAQVGPVIASAVAARGVTPTLRVHAFGRLLYERTLPQLLEKKEKPEAEEEEPEPLATRVDRLLDRVGRVHRRLPAENVLAFLVYERRRIRIEIIELDLDYSFADVATTGKLLGAIYAVSALLPPQVVIRQNPTWEFEDRGEIAASGVIAVWPGLVFVDSLGFLVRNARTLLFPRRAPEAT
jgi:hypothetical protein